MLTGFNKTKHFQQHQLHNKHLNKPIYHNQSNINTTEETLPGHTRHTLSQLRTYKSPLFKSYPHKIDANKHTSPLCSLCNLETLVFVK